MSLLFRLLSHGFTAGGSKQVNPLHVFLGYERRAMSGSAFFQ